MARCDTVAAASRRRWTGLVVAVLAVAMCGTACGGPRAQTPPPVTSMPASTPVIVGSSPVPTPSTTPPTPPMSAEDACVASVMAPMTLRQIVGQVMLVGTPIATPAEIGSAIRTYGVGGVFLAGRSQQSAAQLRSEIAGLQAVAPAGVGLLIALDQEGGEVQTLQGPDFPPIPTAVDQGRLSQSALRTQTVGWAHRLAAVGVTMDLAPVADTVPASIGTENPPIGAYFREYGSDPTAVAADISTVVTAIQSTGVVTTLKHFPGLGRVLENTDTSTGAVDPVTTTTDPYLGPFAAGIRAGTGAVMVSSALYPKLDPHSIAAFSEPIVTGLLRHRLGFHGVIVSDDLGAATALEGVPVSQRAVQFIQAGGSLALTVSLSTAGTMIGGLLSAAQSSPAFATEVTAAARFVIRGKYAAGLLSCSPRP